jgi:uncharacterized protein YecE (DUF72 family)
MGAMTWSYPGWTGVVYANKHSERELATRGLTAYAQQPLLRAAEIDRTYYEPLSAASFARYAEQVPADFRFLVKAHEDCTVSRYPMHARYGKKRGQDNPRYLDASYAAESVVAPLVGLGDKLAALLFQFSPQTDAEPERFAAELHRFLRALPSGVLYAVELRNRQLLSPTYGAALADVGAVHCHNAWSFMPSVLAQAKLLPKQTRRPLLLRWLLRRNDRFAQASERYAPFSRIVSEDPETRAEVASLVSKALQHDVPACVLLDNKAEGCAPESVTLLARALADKRAP